MVTTEPLNMLIASEGPAGLALVQDLGRCGIRSSSIKRGFEQVPNVLIKHTIQLWHLTSLSKHDFMILSSFLQHCMNFNDAILIHCN